MINLVDGEPLTGHGGVSFVYVLYSSFIDDLKRWRRMFVYSIKTDGTTIELQKTGDGSVVLALQVLRQDLLDEIPSFTFRM